MSEDNPWRQLGTIVNAVLLDARSKAICKGTLAAPKPRRPIQKTVRPAGGFLQMREESSLPHKAVVQAPREPVQLELPFGIAAVPEARFESPSARRPRTM